MNELHLPLNTKRYSANEINTTKVNKFQTQQQLLLIISLPSLFPVATCSGDKGKSMEVTVAIYYTNAANFVTLQKTDEL